MSFDADEMVALATEIARAAGALLLERFDGGDERALASKSSPTDLVSEADLASERFIRERLARVRPGDGFLGEEGGQEILGEAGGGHSGEGGPGKGELGRGEFDRAELGEGERGKEERGASALTWVVDPLDGTVNFLFSIPQWCVSVAVRDDHGPLAGAIFDPCRDELFSATRDGPALLNGAAITASDRADLATAMVATGLAYDAGVRSAQAPVLARMIPLVRDIRRFGSAALDLAWTAAGRYDAYFERSVKPWDIEAGVLLCERAGLRVAELPEREGLPWGVLASAPAIAEALLEVVS